MVIFSYKSTTLVSYGFIYFSKRREYQIQRAFEIAAQNFACDSYICNMYVYNGGGKDFSRGKV